VATVPDKMEAGALKITVSTDGGSVTSDDDFMVSVPLLVKLLYLDPSSQISGGTFEVHGINIRDATLDADLPATGTTVKFAAKGQEKEVYPEEWVGETKVMKIKTLDDVPKSDKYPKHQAIEVTVPERDGNWSVKET
jgi:hypothetical protein